MPIDASLTGKTSNGIRSGFKLEKRPGGRDLQDWASSLAILYGSLAALCLVGFQDLGVFAGWYAFDSEPYRSSGAMTEVFFVTLVILGAGLNLLLFATATRFVKIGGLHQKPYHLLFEFMGIATSCIILATIVVLTLPTAPLFAIPIGLLPLAVVLGATLRAYYGNSERAKSLRRRAAASFLKFTLRAVLSRDDESLRLRQSHLFRQDNPLWQALALVYPAVLALAGLGSTALLIAFAWPNLGIIFEFFGGPETLVAERRAWPFFAWGPNYIFAAVCLLAVLMHWPAIRILGRRGRPIIIWAGTWLIVLAVILAFSALASYALFVDPIFGSGLVHGSGYGFCFVLALSSLAVQAFYHTERLYPAILTQRDNLRYGRFWSRTLEISNQFPQPKVQPSGYVFLNTLTDVNTIASVLLVLCRLRQLGWATIIVDRWPVPPEKTGEQSLDRFFSSKFGTQRVLNFDWTIDWDNRIVEAAGLNFYHPIWEGLSRHFGRYTISLEEKEAENIFRDILLLADSALLLAQRIYTGVAGQGRSVRVIGGSGQFVPNAVFNIYCREIGKDRDMHFVWVQQGYQTYYKDKATLSDRISIENMTRKWPYSNPYLAHKDDFEAWVAKGQDARAIVAEAEQWANTHRASVSQEIAPKAREVLDRIEAHREAGGKVICLFGKMVFDLSTPWEGGPVHSGMDDWLNHSIEAVGDADDVLLLIKPHPYEVRPEIAGVVEQFFTDLIDVRLPDNVVVLAHNWFNLSSLTPHLDLGVLWNGTSALELGLKNVPVVMCADWGPIDYPIGFPIPKDREDYERMLCDPKSVVMPEGYPEKCALLLKFTASDEVMIPYAYCARPLTNAPFGPPVWHMDQVQEFIAKGDPFIDAAARKIY